MLLDMRYSHAEWARLGRAVHAARMKAGLRDTQAWADKVGRSSRTLLGLERGEAVGSGTITAIETALGWPGQYAYSVLADPDVGPPPVQLLTGAQDAAVRNGLSLSTEGRDRLLGVLRNIRQSADDAVKILGG